MSKPRILLLDIETAPCLAYVWGLFDQNPGINMLKSDQYVLAWSAKWYGESKIMYMDQRSCKDIENDQKILQGVWKLIDEADLIVAHNGKSFDMKKLNARFIIHGMKPPSSYRVLDTKIIAKRHFAFTSNKLEYLSGALKLKFKKLKHAKFPGFELWRECLKGNKAAWKEMEEYNKYDVLALEELYKKFAPWDNSVNMTLYTGAEDTVCGACGHDKFVKNGFAYQSTGKFQRYACLKCGAEIRDRRNILSKDSKRAIKVHVKK